MPDNSKMLYLIEHALDAHPRCAVCGSPTTIQDEACGLWLVCASANRHPVGLRARLDAAILPHDRSLVTDLCEDLAA